MLRWVWIMLSTVICMCSGAHENDPQLGLTKLNDGWQLVVWSSQATEMEVRFYEEHSSLEPRATLQMSETGERYWSATWGEEMDQLYYTVRAKIGGQWGLEVVEPYAKLVGVNGSRAYVGDASKIVPDGWSNDTYVKKSPQEAVIYELHVRDFSIDPKAGFKYPGKFLAFTEKGLKRNGTSFGIDHLKELGITHVHLLPSFDFRSIDESSLEQGAYNWGYDPLNYNVPEGSYSTDPATPEVRVLEFRQMVMALHTAGIGVIMDVVYNHTGLTETSSFHQLDPGYYHRMIDGDFSNASACGNETASERAMMRRFIIESMSYWMEEYHIDGFRIDLMGIHDMETMNLAKARLSEINPNTLVYGEGWAAGESPLDPSLRALKQNTSQLDGIAVFSDEFRDALKGHWNTYHDPGFVTGKTGQKESLKFGLVGGVYHPQVQYDLVNYTDAAWADKASSMIAYVSCHDGPTLYDKLKRSYPGLSEEQYMAKQKLAATFVLTSQGIPFLHAGFEFLRSKDFVENSFESPDSINAINWTLKTINRELVDYTQALIAIRSAHELFRLNSTEQIQASISFPETEDELLLAYQIDGLQTSDPWSRVLLLFNGDLETKQFQVPKGHWYYKIQNGQFLKGAVLESAQIDVAASSATLLYQLSE